MRWNWHIFMKLTCAAALIVPGVATAGGWRDDVRRIYCTAYYCDVSNRVLPLGSLLGFNNSARIADFSGDGLPDLMVGVMYTANKLILNRGDGLRMKDVTLGRLPQVDRATEELAVADFDGDGDLDAVAANTGNVHAEIYINNGEGSFTLDESLPVDSSNGVVAIDLSNDGLPDLLFSNRGQDRLYINLGNGRFADETETRIPEDVSITNDMALGDVDGDGDIDIVLAKTGPNAVWINDGKGHFTADSLRELFHKLGDQETWTVTLADVDGDKDLDIFFGNVTFAKENIDISDQLLINDGQGNFKDESDTRLPRQKVVTVASQFVDLNGDGALDIVLGTFTDDTWGRRHDAPWLAYVNTGNGVFRDETKSIFPPTTTGNGRYVEVADFDGDGRPDLYLASRGGPDLLLINVYGRDRQHPLIRTE